jgi:ubiquinone/menaquinone biosynthesis C-methylase UbiE
MAVAPRRIVRAGYDRVADWYLAARRVGDDADLLPALVARLAAGDTVLDAGCGAGVPFMADLLAADLAVVGLDLSAAQLALARTRVPGAHLVHGDLTALPFADASFAGLISIYAVIHVPRTEHPAVFSEFRRVLRPGGAALLCLGAGDLPEDHDPESWLGAPMYWSHYDAATNLDLLDAAGFTIDHHELVEDPMDHGRHLFALVFRP